MKKEARDRWRKWLADPQGDSYPVTQTQVLRLLDYVDMLEAALIEIRDGSIKSTPPSHKAREVLARGKRNEQD